MDRMSSILHMSKDGCLNLIVVCCVLLFSIFEAPFRAPRKLVR